MPKEEKKTRRHQCKLNRFLFPLLKPQSLHRLRFFFLFLISLSLCLSTSLLTTAIRKVKIHSNSEPQMLTEIIDV